MATANQGLKIRNSKVKVLPATDSQVLFCFNMGCWETYLSLLLQNQDYFYSERLLKLKMMVLLSASDCLSKELPKKQLAF